MLRREFLLAPGAAALTRRAVAGRYSLPPGYAAITWRGNDEQAIDDIAAVGFHGIQLRSPAMERYGARPEGLRRRLSDRSLSLTCFSSGTVDADPAKEAQYLATHADNARLVKAGGMKFTPSVAGSRERILSTSRVKEDPGPEVAIRQDRNT